MKDNRFRQFVLLADMHLQRDELRRADLSCRLVLSRRDVLFRAADSFQKVGALKSTNLSLKVV